jgi:hypothetical protein
MSAAGSARSRQIPARQSEPQRGAPGCSITNSILKLRSSRYRIFADLERQAERFPRALHRNGGAPHEVVIAGRWRTTAHRQNF